VQEYGIGPAAQENTRRTGSTEFMGLKGRQKLLGTCRVLCKGEVQGTFAQKYKNCEMRDFYTELKHEEFPQLQLSAILLAKLKN